MSKIQKELSDAAEIDPKRDEERQAFLLRLAMAVNKLPNAVWDALSEGAQNWMNDAADAATAKKPLPEFPDAEPPASGSSRRRVVAEEPATFTPKVKDDVKVTTKRGKVVTGKIVEMDKEVVVLKTPAGDEEELPLDRIEKIEPLAGGSKPDPAEEGPRDPVKGDTVTVTTKRGKVVTGVLVELSDSDIVLKVDGGEEDFPRDRVESIKIEGGRKSDSAASGSGRRSLDGDKKDAPADDGKRTRASNGSVSVGTRIRELIIEDFNRTADDIGKILKKENLEFRDNTLTLNYAEAHKMLELLKKAGKLK